MKAIQSTKNTAISDAGTGLTKLMTTAKATFDKTEGEMKAARDAVKAFISKTAGFEEETKKLEYQKTVETKENTNYAKIAADMKTQETAVDALVGDAGKGLTKKLADAQAVLGASDAAGLKKGNKDTDAT